MKSIQEVETGNVTMEVQVLSDISNDHEPNTFYENGEFPIKIVITDRNRSMSCLMTLLSSSADI